MAGLSIKLLGPFQVTRDGRTVEGFESNKVRALLAYLAAERQRPHARESLAGLLWPDYPQRSALNNLRSALANLRKTIGDRDVQPAYLLISRETLQFNQASDHHLDIAHFADLSQQLPEQLEQAVSAYAYGRFLDGFSLADSAPFEEWLLYKREQYNRRFLEALQRLGAHYEACGDYGRAITCAHRALEIEPWLEEAHRSLMRNLAFSGQRSAALVQYESCRRVLEEELGISPAPETTALLEKIRDGTLQPAAAFLLGESEVLASQTPVPGEAPFKGLKYFEEADAARFFGREQLTAQLVALLAECHAPNHRGSRFLAVIGASGSGKSSVVRAGLVPALRCGQTGSAALPGGTAPVPSPFTGPICTFTPTAHPLEALAIALTGADSPLAKTTELLDSLAHDPRSLHLAAARMSHDNGGKILLIIDQFEELFTLCHNQSERQTLVDNLLYAAGTPGPVIVVVVLRADFYAHCAPYASLRRALSEHQQFIGAMNAEEIHRAISEPARQGGWAFEPGLVDLMLRDVGDEVGALPLLSHALLETWQRRRGRTLTLAGYQESGGVQGAITQTAETTYKQMTPQQQTIARSMFLRLTELGESTVDETLPAYFTRRRAALVELIPNEQIAAEAQAVLLKLVEARLITTGQETAEITHEALIQEWARLREWLDESRETLRMQRRLTAAAQEWERLDHDSGALYRGARLAQAAEWALVAPDQLSMLEQRFITASVAEEQAEQAAETARQQRELETAQSLAEEQRKRAETEAQRAEDQEKSASKLRRRSVWLALAVGALLLLFLVALGLGQLANRNALAAQEQTQLAISRELAAAAGNNLAADPERSVLLALQALQTADTLEARNALHQALPELHVLRTIPAHPGGVPGISFSPDGKRLASIGVDPTIKIWDKDSGELLMTLPGDAGEQGYDVAYSRDGTQIAAVGGSQVVFWDAASGERLFSLPGVTEGTVRRLAFSPDGQRLAVASMDGRPRVWDLASQTVSLTFEGHDVICEAIAYSPEGKRLATGDVAGLVKIWDANSGEELHSFEHGGGIHSVAFSPDGTQLAVASDNSRLGLWDATNAEPLFSLPVRSGIYDVDYMPDGKRLIATHQDGTTSIWDPDSGQRLLLLAGHVSTTISAVPNPDNNLLATGGYDGTIKLWDINPGRELLTIAAHEEPAYDIAYSRDGSRLVTVGFDGQAKLWDSTTGLLVRSLPPEESVTPLSSMELSADGQRLAIGGWDGTLFVANMDSDQMKFVLPAHMGPIIDLAFTADGRQLATASWDGTAKIWDLNRGEETLRIASRDEEGNIMMISGVSFNPDGSRLYTGGDDDAIHEWDAMTGEELRHFSSDDLDVYGVATSPDGRKVAMGRQDGMVMLWDVATGDKLQQIPAHAGLILRLAFSADGSQLASVGFDSLAKVWDVETGQELMTLYGVTGNVFGAAFSPDNKHLATAGGDGTVHLYTLEMDELVELARERVTRTLTVEECRNFLHVEQCPTTQ